MVCATNCELTEVVLASFSAEVKATAVPVVIDADGVGVGVGVPSSPLDEPDDPPPDVTLLLPLDAFDEVELVTVVSVLVRFDEPLASKFPSGVL